MNANVLSIEVIANAIKTNVALTPEQTEEAKKIALTAMQKFFNGEIISEAEQRIQKYCTSLIQKANAKAKTFADNEAKKAEAKAKYEKEMQAFKLDLQASVNAFFKGFKTKDTDNLNSISDVKKLFSDFVATLPKEPKLEGVKVSKESSSGASDYKNPKAAKNIAEGSTNWHIKQIVAANAEGLTKKEIKEALKLACPDKSEITLTLTLDKAINGRLPLVLVGEKYIWKEEEVELEVVETPAENEK